MSSQRYTRENLELLQKGFNQLFYLFIDFAEHNPSAKTKDVVRRLGSNERETWVKIKEEFDTENLYEAPSENSDPIKALVAIFSTMDELREELLQNTKAWDDKETQLVRDNEDLKDQVETMKVETANVQHRLRLAEAELRSSESTIKHLEKNIRDKDEKINGLQRSQNVSLWEKEKERAFESHIAKEKELQTKLETTERDLRMKCERYEKRIQDIKNGQMSEKIQTEVDSSRRETSSVDKAELDEMKRRVYYLGKDLLGAERIISQLQKDTSGVLLGVERDFRIVHHKMIDNKQLTMSHMDKLANWLSKLHNAFKDGNMRLALKEMPDYYRTPDLKITPIQIRKLSAVKISGSGQSSKKTLEDLVSKVEQDVWEIETERTMKQASSKEISNGAANNVATSSQEMDNTNEHPQLIYDNGKVNTTALIKHFPMLSVAFVQDQWANFKRYDRNGDGTLDLAEMMTAITSTLGHKFTAQEVVEVMTEVDDDQSSTLDFFEYLKVSIIIVKKNGKAAMFQSAHVNKNKKQISQTCVVQ